MKNFYFLLLLCLSSQSLAAVQGGNPCLDPDSIINSKVGATSGTTAVEIIAAVTGQQVYVCSLHVWGVSGTTPTLSLVYGTGTNCATGQTVFLQAFTTTAAQFYGFDAPFARVPGAVCYLDTGTTPVQNYHISYVQK